MPEPEDIKKKGEAAEEESPAYRTEQPGEPRTIGEEEDASEQKVQPAEGLPEHP